MYSVEKHYDGDNDDDDSDDCIVNNATDRTAAGVVLCREAGCRYVPTASCTMRDIVHTV